MQTLKYQSLKCHLVVPQDSSAFSLWLRGGMQVENAILQWAQSTENKGINSETKIPGATGNHFLVKTFGLSCFNHNLLRGKIKLQTSHDLGVP